MSTAADRHPAGPDSSAIGAHVREARRRRGLSLRALAGAVGISASALSQIENEQTRPSVTTLCAIVNQLGGSFDELFGAAGSGHAPRAHQSPPPRGDLAEVTVQTTDDRRRLLLESGVFSEHLTPANERSAEFLIVNYEIGASSSRDTLPTTCGGREYGLVLEGKLTVTVGHDAYVLGPGDSIMFASSRARRLENRSDVRVSAVWLVVGGDHGGD